MSKVASRINARLPRARVSDCARIIGQDSKESQKFPDAGSSSFAEIHSYTAE
jgi:hypothetical protein